MTVIEVATQTNHLVRIDVSGAEIEASAALGIDPLVGPEGMEFILSGPTYHDWNPSGTRLVYLHNLALPDATPEWHFFVYDLETGVHRRILAVGNYGVQPSWSPNGSRILFDGSAGSALILINPENDLDAPGGLQDSIVFKQDTSRKTYSRAKWSPDGSQLIYTITDKKQFFSWTRTTVRAALADGVEVNLGLGNVAPFGF